MQTKKKALIFVGQSGAGKGTQVELLKQKLLDENNSQKLFVVETGAHFREFIKGNNFTESLTKEYIESGKLPPSFLGVYVWSKAFIQEYNGEEIVLIDGTPRIIDEVPILLGACEFYDLEPTIINISVSDSWAYEKTKNRGRSDDSNEEELKGRIEWYHSRVEPVIAKLKDNTFVKFHIINGEQTISQVHQGVLKALNII